MTLSLIKLRTLLQQGFRSKWVCQLMALSVSVQGWIRIQSQHPFLLLVLTEAATSLAKEQYTIHNTGTPR